MKGLRRARAVPALLTAVSMLFGLAGAIGSSSAATARREAGGPAAIPIIAAGERPPGPLRADLIGTAEIASGYRPPEGQGRELGSCQAGSARGIATSDMPSAVVRGCFLAPDGRARPYLEATVHVPSVGRRIDVHLLVDTGADRSVLSPQDASRLGIDHAALPRGQEVGGLGGRTDTRLVDATLSFESAVVPVTLTVLEPGARQGAFPSLLGRDVLSQFALFMDERRGRVLLFDPRAADALLP